MWFSIFDGSLIDGLDADGAELVKICDRSSFEALIDMVRMGEQCHDVGARFWREFLCWRKQSWKCCSLATGSRDLICLQPRLICYIHLDEGGSKNLEGMISRKISKSELAVL